MKMRRAARLAGRICSGAVTAVLAVLLAANLYVLAAQRLGTEDPAVLGLRSAVVLTGSMSGTIEPDDLVVTHEEASYDAGDIIMFRSGSHTVTHRITAVTAEGYRTRGDANNTEDPAIYPDSVIGVYRGRIPKLGDFALFLQKPLGMAVFIGIPVCTFVIGDVIRRRKQAQHSDEETARLREELERLKAASGSGAAPQ